MDGGHLTAQMASYSESQIERALRGLGIDESHADLFARVTRQGSGWTEFWEARKLTDGDPLEGAPLLRWRWRFDMESTKIAFEMEMTAEAPREVARILRGE